MHKHTFVNFALASLLFVGFAGCSTTGGDIGGLFPAPKFLKGSIENNVYTSKDKLFSIAIPHKQGSYEYKYMQVKEEYHNGYDYVSFGPAAFDQSIYRVEVVPRAPPGEARPSLNEAASKFLMQVEQMMQNAYGAQAVVTQSNKTQVNGRNALYWQLKQVVPAGKLNSSNPVTLTHDVYVIDFDDAVGIVWVQNQTGASSSPGEKSLTPEQFASSLKIKQVAYNADQRLTSAGVYHFAKYPVSVVSPAVLCNEPGLIAVEADSSVDFAASDHLWQTAGDFAVQLYARPEKLTGTGRFFDVSKKYFISYIPNDRKSLGVSLKLTSTKQTQVNGLPAVQAIGIEETQAVLVATSILTKSRIIVVSLLYPLKSGGTPESDFPWSCYAKFVASVNDQD